jgi:rhodanese-related sulfurtransferase
VTTTLRTFIVIALSMIVAATCVWVTPLRYTQLFPPPHIREISPRAFYALAQKQPNQYLIIDVRQADAFKVEHLPNSQNIPVANLYDMRTTLPRSGKTIVLICGSNSASGVAYEYLQHYGYTNLMRISGGVPAWALSNLPLVGTAINQ